MKRGHQRNEHQNKHTSQLLDQFGPEGRVCEKERNNIIGIFYTYLFNIEIFLYKTLNMYQRIIYLYAHMKVTHTLKV